MSGLPDFRASSSMDSRPGSSRSSSRLQRPSSSLLVHKMNVTLAEKAKTLPTGVKDTFSRLMDDMHVQETETMISFIEEARRSLAQTLDDLEDEQHVLAMTSHKLSESRLKSAGSSRSLPTPRPRTGVVAERHARVKSARNGRQPVYSDDIEMTPMSARSFPDTARVSKRREVGSAMRRSATPGSSMDSVTFESELTQSQQRERQRLAEELILRAPISTEVESYHKPRKTTVETHPKPRTTTVETHPKPSEVAYGAEPYHSDIEYEEEKEEVMKQMRGAQSKIESERQRQAELLEKRKAKKKAKQQQTEQIAESLVREASVLEDTKQKEKERHDQRVKERLEERKRLKQERADNNLTTVVVHAADDDNQADLSNITADQPKESKVKVDKEKKKKKSKSTAISPVENLDDV